MKNALYQVLLSIYATLGKILLSLTIFGLTKKLIELQRVFVCHQKKLKNCMSRILN